MQVIYCIFLPIITGKFNRFSAGARVTDRLPDGSTDKSDEVQMEGNFPRKWSFRKFHPGILVDIFTVKLADGWMDRMDDEHTDGWMEFQVESQLC